MDRPISKAVALKTYAKAGPLGADADLVADSATFFGPDAGRPAEWISVGVAGDINVMTSNGSTDLIPHALAGQPIYCEVSKILATGTTAQKITAGW